MIKLSPVVRFGFSLNTAAVSHKTKLSISLSLGSEGRSAVCWENMLPKKGYEYFILFAN